MSGRLNLFFGHALLEGFLARRELDVRCPSCAQALPSLVIGVLEVPVLASSILFIRERARAEEIFGDGGLSSAAVEDFNLVLAVAYPHELDEYVVERRA